MDEALRIGSTYKNGKLHIYHLFQQGLDTKTIMDRLKKEYGVSYTTFNSSNGSLGSINSDGKGITIQQSGSEKKLTWAAVRKRLSQLIDQGIYLTAEEQAQYDREYPKAPGMELISNADLDAVLVEDWGVWERKKVICALAKQNLTDEQLGEAIMPFYNVSPDSRLDWQRTDGYCTLADGSKGYAYYVAAEMRIARRPNGEMRIVPYTELAHHIKELVRAGKYLTEEEQRRYDAEFGISQPEPTPEAPASRPTLLDGYNAIKEAHPGDIVLYQVGDFYEILGEDAKIANRELGLTLTTRPVGTTGRVDMCGLPKHALDTYVERLRSNHGVTVATLDDETGQHTATSMPPLGAPAPAQTPPISQVRHTAAPAPAQTPSLRAPTYLEIDTAIQRWNGDITSKHAVVRYMDKHAREQDTARWLQREFGGDLPAFPVSEDAAVRPVPWPRVQHRIARLIQQDKFYTQEEYDNYDDIDPVAVRENLENGTSQQFVEQVMADVERIAAQEQSQSQPPEPEEPARDPLASPYKVGDEVYLENTLYHITKVTDTHVTLADPALLYPIDRVERKETFEKLLRDEADQRNGPITEFLDASGLYPDQDLREILTSGLLGERDKAYISKWFADGEGNTRVAQRLSELYAGNADTMTLITGEQADYFPTTINLEYNIQGRKGNVVADGSVSWVGVAQILRTLYNQELDGFSHEPKMPEAANLEGVPTYQEGDEVVVPYHDRDIKGTITHVGEKEVTVETGPYAWSVETVSRPHFDEAIRQDERNAGLFTPEDKLPAAQNFNIINYHLGEVTPKLRCRLNLNAIRTLKQIEAEGRTATPSEQHTLSEYTGWGSLPDVFDPEKTAWAKEYAELKELLTDQEYASARASTLNAHFTSPTVIHAVYEGLEKLGFEGGNILEPSCGVGNFFGLLPLSMEQSKLYGVELDSITGRMAQQLYPQAHIQVKGYEKTDFPQDFFDVAIGNVPFGQYQVDDPVYNNLKFNIHNYFFAKALDQVRPGGVVAFLTSRYTMDAKDSTVRQYLAQRADLLGAIRLPNTAFKANAGTDVVSDIIFLQRRDTPAVELPDWVQTGQTPEGFTVNHYFLDHPDMVLGTPTTESTQYASEEYTVAPTEGVELADQLHEAVGKLQGHYIAPELPELGEDGEEQTNAAIPADPSVRNYSYAVVDGEVYYRENSVMVRPEINATMKQRILGMVELRDSVHRLIDLQINNADDLSIVKEQSRLNRLYDAYTAKYGLINSRGNALAFADDSAYYLLCSLEVLDEDGNLERKADIFDRRTIKPHQAVAHVDTSAEALAVSISERAKVDLPFMAQLSGKSEETLVAELRGVIYRDFGTYTPEDLPEDYLDRPAQYVTADEYLSGNVRQKLQLAKHIADVSDELAPELEGNIAALEAVIPPDLTPSEIDVRLGATWIDKKYIQQFMEETFKTPPVLRNALQVQYSDFTGEWFIKEKSRVFWNDVAAFTTYGTQRASAYRILEDTLNLRDVRIYDTVYEGDEEKRVLNPKETTLAQQKQQLIKDAFRDWVWQDMDRREALVRVYNDTFNSVRPREYDGRHITFGGINPEIQLRGHQLNAIAHVLYGGNTLLAHEVGAGKTFEMVAAAMESKRLGLCRKSLFAVPNHLIEQWAGEFLRLYPSAKILVARKKDFEARNRKKFCAKIATGDYDAIIMGHSQFERIPVSQERQEELLGRQIDEITDGIAEMKANRAEKFSIKQMERTKRQLEARLKKLQSRERKDDVVTFEQLGVDRLFVDEAHNYKNLFLYTKMRNVAGLSTSDAQKSSDMYLKCQYMDEITDGKGVVFATGTPVSNSMTELYTMQRYLQSDLLQRKSLSHFDSWASVFGETVTAIELAPEGYNFCG